MERTNCEMQIEELMKKSNEICVMANEPLAEEILKTLEETVDKPILVKVKGWQMIAVSPIGKRKLYDKLGEMRREALKEVHELEKYEKKVWELI